MELRRYQQEAHDATLAAYSNGVKRPIVVLPTGGGKTVLFSHVIKSRGGRALVLAHRDELLDQAKKKILSVIPGAHVGIVQAGLDQHQSDIVIGSVQTLSRDHRLKQVTPNFDTVVIDEAHHATANSYQKIVDYFAASDPLILGVTATPDRGDGKRLDTVFDEIVYEVTIEQGISEGWLCDIEGRLITIKGLDLSKVHTNKGDLDGTELEALMNASNWHDHAGRALIEHASDRPTVVFVPKVQMAHDLAAHLATQGMRAAAIDGKPENRSKRRDALARMSGGDLQVIVNCGVLTEGFDEPALSCVTICRPTKSGSLYRQMIGRGLRPHDGKRNCLVLDLVGNSQRLDLITVASLAGVKRLGDGESFAQAKLRAEEEARETERQKQCGEERKRLEVELAAHRVDVLRGSFPELDHKSHKRASIFHWTDEGGNRQVLQLRDRKVIVRPMADGSWIAQNGSWQHIGNGAEECRAAAESYARKIQYAAEAWRLNPASEKQLATLAQYKIKHRREITAGEASEIIGRLFAGRKGKR